MSTKEDEAALITLVATDRNGDALSYQITSLPTHGKLYKGNSTAAADEITNTSLPFTLPNSGNQVKYVPNANYNNTPDDDPDNFTFQAKDSKRTSNSATISIRVDPVNDAPVAFDDSYEVNEDGVLVADGLGGNPGGVLANDTDADAGAALSARLRSCPEFGILPSGSFPCRLNANGSFSYMAPPNYNGPDSFTYEAYDGTAVSNLATVTITVNSVNDPPVVDLDSEDRVETGIDTTVLFTEHFTPPGFPPGGVPKVLAPRTTVSDIDDTILVSAEIKLTNRPDGNDESLSMDLEVLRGTSIDSLGYDPETGILALFGPDTLANFQKVLRTVSYDNREAPADHSDRLVTFKVNDGEADSQIATATVKVRCSQADPSCFVP